MHTLHNIVPLRWESISHQWTPQRRCYAHDPQTTSMPIGGDWAYVSWHCTTISLDNSTLFQMTKSHPAISEIQFFTHGHGHTGKGANNPDFEDYRSRKLQLSRPVVIRENPSSSFGDRSFFPMDTSIGANGQMTWHCTTTGQSNPVELCTEKIHPVLS